MRLGPCGAKWRARGPPIGGPRASLSRGPLGGPREVARLVVPLARVEYIQYPSHALINHVPELKISSRHLIKITCYKLGITINKFVRDPSHNYKFVVMVTLCLSHQNYC